MNSAQQWRGQLTSRAKVGIVFVAAAVCVIEAIGGNWLATGAAVLTLGTAAIGGGSQVAALSLAIGVGAIAPAVIAVLDLLLWLATRFWVKGGAPDQLNESALAAAVAALPSQVRSQVEAAAEQGRAVDTAAIIKAAARAAPQHWGHNVDLLLQSSTSDEGGLIAGTRWTCCAAEAALAMQALAAIRPNIDIQLLAAAASMIPNALADERAQIAERATSATGLGRSHLAEALSATTRLPGGELLLTRASLLLDHSPGSSRLLTEAAWSELRRGGRVERRTMADGLYLGRPAGPAPRFAPSARPPMREAASAQSGTRPTAKAPPAQAPPVAQTPPAITDPGPQLPGPSQAATATGATSAGAPTPRTPPVRATILARTVARVRQGGWSDPLALLWFGLRPACTVAALAVTAWRLVADPSGSTIAALLVVALIRPNGLIWLGAGATAVLAPLLPVAAIVVGLRTLLTAGVQIAAGRQWRRPRAALITFRRRMTGVGDVDAAWAELADASQRLDLVDKLAFLDGLGPVLLAAWCTTDLRIEAATLWRCVRGVLVGRWPYGTVRPSLEFHIMRLSIFEEGIDSVCGNSAWLITAVGLWTTVDQGGATFHNWHIPGLVSIILAAFLAKAFVIRGPRGSRGRAIGTWVVLTGLTGGRHSIVYIGVAILVGLAALAVRDWLQRRLIARPIRQPRPPWCWKYPLLFAAWSAAQRAVREGQPSIGIKLWTDLTAETRWPAPVRAHAWAAVAGLQLDAGEVQPALESVGKAAALLPAGSERRRDAQIAATTGRVRLAAGDLVAAAAQLDRALRYRRHRRNPQLLAARAQLIALSDPKAADELLARSSVGLLRAGRLEEVIDTEVAVVARLRSSADPGYVENRLEELIQFDLGDLGSDFELPEQLRVAAAVARGRLLLARLRLERGENLAAANELRRAIADFRRPVDIVERATAQILLASALLTTQPVDSLQELITGLDTLETARGQLRLGQNRSQLVTRHADTYTTAFDALTQLQADLPQAGLHAAELSESLRRNALAQTLRSGSLQLTGPVGHILAAVARLEGSGNADTEQVAQLRTQLAAELSQRFAAAYLPERVSMLELRSRLGNAHSLSYRIHRADAEVVAGHVVWTPPAGLPVVQRIEITSATQLRVLGLRDTQERRKIMAQPHTGDHVAPWRELAAALIPDPLRRLLAGLDVNAPAHLVIVADGPMGLLPWAALPLTDDLRLIDVATLQHVPTVDLIEDPKVAAPRRLTASNRLAEPKLLVYLDPATPSLEERFRLSEAHGATFVTSLAKVLSELSAGELAGAYLAAHGRGAGLEQAVSFDGTGTLSAASALGVPWPDWTLFASCLVGRTEFAVGDEPLGLLTSCLLGGSRTAIGGIIDINNATTGRIASKAAIAMLGGKHPCEALRSEQLRYLQTPRRPAAPERWAGLVCVSRRMPDRCFR